MVIESDPSDVNHRSKKRQEFQASPSWAREAIRLVFPLGSDVDSFVKKEADIFGDILLANFSNSNGFSKYLFSLSVLLDDCRDSNFEFVVFSSSHVVFNYAAFLNDIQHIIQSPEGKSSKVDNMFWARSKTGHGELSSDPRRILNVFNQRLALFVLEKGRRLSNPLEDADQMFDILLKKYNIPFITMDSVIVGVDPIDRPEICDGKNYTKSISHCGCHEWSAYKCFSPVECQTATKILNLCI